MRRGSVDWLAVYRRLEGDAMSANILGYYVSVRRLPGWQIDEGSDPVVGPVVDFRR